MLRDRQNPRRQNPKPLANLHITPPPLTASHRLLLPSGRSTQSTPTPGVISAGNYWNAVLIYGIQPQRVSRRHKDRDSVEADQATQDLHAWNGGAEQVAAAADGRAAVALAAVV